MSSRKYRRHSTFAVGRLGGCLWLALAGFAFLFIISAATVVGGGIATLLVPLVLLPFLLALVLFIAGHRSGPHIVSAVAGFGYAGLGVWNYFRAAAFEAANPGSSELSGDEVSLAFAGLAAMTAFWSLVVAWLSTRRRHNTAFGVPSSDSQDRASST